MTQLQNTTPPPPIYIPDGATQERDKYTEIWGFEDYKKYSPGDDAAKNFLDVLKPSVGSSVIDVGCGQGNAGLALQAAGLNVQWLDITDAPLREDVPRHKFTQAALWDNWSAGLDIEYGFCVDVLEHIPPEYTMLCVDRIVSACAVSWLQIANLPESHGELIGETLHLTVRPFLWWLIRLETIGHVVDARDLCGRSLFIVEPK